MPYPKVNKSNFIHMSLFKSRVEYALNGKEKKSIFAAPQSFGGKQK